MFPREAAADWFSRVRGLDERRPLMADVTEAWRERLQLLARAQAAISAARGTPKHLLGDPTDEQLDAMAAVVASIHARISNRLAVFEARIAAEGREREDMKAGTP